MSKVQVWNDHHQEHVEKVAETIYKIPAGGYIDLPRSVGIRLLSQFAPVYKPGVGDAPPKKLRMVEPEKEAAARLRESSKSQNACMQCAQSFNTGRELEVHIEMNHEELQLKEEVKKDDKPSRRKTGS